MEKNKPKSIEIRQVREKILFLEKLKEYPVIASACKMAGIGRATHYRWCTEDSDFAAAVEDALSTGKSFVSDIGESKVMAAIKNSEPWAIMFWLRSHHPDYKQNLNIRAQINPADTIDMRRHTEVLRAFAEERLPNLELFEDKKGRSTDDYIAQLKKDLAEE